MTLFSEAKGRKVVSLDSAVTVGKVDDYVVDPATRSVAALVLKKTAGAEETLPWSNINAFGDDAVTVSSAEAIVAPDDSLAELAAKQHAMHGKRVLSTEGVELGSVKDIDFDPSTGALGTIVLKDAAVEGSTLLAVGSYAVVVKA